MIRHVVLISWVPEVTAEQVRRVETELNALKPLIGGLRDYQIGPDLGIIEGNADFAVVGDFSDEESYLLYRDHPAHRKVIEEAINPIARQRVAVQYRLGPWERPGTGLPGLWPRPRSRACGPQARTGLAAEGVLSSCLHDPSGTP